MSNEQMMAELNRLREENAKLKAKEAEGKLSLRVSDAGYVEVYGIPGKGRYSVSNTPEGWTALFGMQDKIKSFVSENSKFCEAKLQAYRSTKAAG